MEVSQKLICMAKVQNFSEISPDLPFTEFDFYELYRQTFATSELGKIRKRLPLREMAENFGLISKSMRAKKGRKTYFTPESKVALMFLKMYTGLSSPKLMEHLNGNVHYQLFCDVRIDPMHPLTNYKLMDDVFSELARGLKIQQQQEILARAWKPYMKDLDTMYTDATCYESEMLTNQTLRRRLGIEQKNYSMVSRLIKEALENGLIQDADPGNNSKKYKGYLPYWA